MTSRLRRHQEGATVTASDVSSAKSENPARCDPARAVVAYFRGRFDFSRLTTLPAAGEEDGSEPELAHIFTPPMKNGTLRTLQDEVLGIGTGMKMLGIYQGTKYLGTFMWLWLTTLIQDLGLEEEIPNESYTRR